MSTPRFLLNFCCDYDHRYDFRLLHCGGSQSRINLHVNLSEPFANCSVSSGYCPIGTGFNSWCYFPCQMNAAVLSGKDQVLDLHSSVVHFAPETSSEQQHHVLLGESGRAVFKGHIRIPQSGQKSVANQNCRGILLADKCRIQAMPTLEITADDVICSHGAAISDLDESDLFFLSTRGISQQVCPSCPIRSF